MEKSALLTAALLWGVSTSQLNVLSLALQGHGISEGTIANILSAAMIAAIAALFVSGPLINRIGATRTLVVGAIISAAAFITMPFVLDFPWLIGIARAAQGVGFALFTPAGQLLAKALAPEAEIHAVGQFTAMFVIPTFFGPTIGAATLHLGENWYFSSAALPIVAALMIVSTLPWRATAPPPIVAGYGALVRDRSQWLPNLAVAQAGIGYGFIGSFLAVLLATGAVSVTSFFVPFGLLLLALRLYGLKHLQRLPVSLLTNLGLVSFSVSFLILAVRVSTSTAIVAALLAAVGYAVIFPASIKRATSPFPPDQHAKPVALINVTFNLGSLFAIQMVGLTLPVFGWRSVLTVLCFVILSVAALSTTETIRAMTVLHRGKREV